MDHLSGYQYYKIIPITGAANASTGYQVPLVVHSGVGVDAPGVAFLDGDALDFPNDIRCTDVAGTPLSYWIVDATADPITIWIKVADDLSGDQNIRIYYRNASPEYDGLVAVATPTGLDGRYGIYSGANPQAMYYSGTHNRTYIAFQDPNCDPYITYYDHVAGTFAVPVKVANTPIPKDSHSGGALAIDANGRIHYFYGAHGSVIKWTRSVNPEDIAAWEAPKDVGVAAETYPHPIIVGGTMWLFYRHFISPTQDTEEYRTSATFAGAWGAAVFGAATTLIDFGNNFSPYFQAMPALDGNDIHLIWNEYDDALGARVDSYYAWYDDSAAQWKDAAGTNLGASIGRNEGVTKIVDTGADVAHADDIRLNSSGKPYIILRRADALYIAEYTAGWNVTQISAATHRKGVLEIITDTDFVVWAVTHTGILKKYTSDDTGATWDTPTTEYVNQWRVNNLYYYDLAWAENQPSDILKFVVCRGYYEPAKLYAFGYDLPKSKSDADRTLQLMENGEKEASADWSQNDESYGDLPLDSVTKRSGSYSLKLDDTDGGNTFIIADISPISYVRGKADFWVKFAETDTIKMLIMTDEVVVALQVRFLNNGDIEYFDGAYQDTGANYQAVNWEHYEIEWDSVNDVIRIVRDDIEIAANAMRQAFDALNEFRWQGYSTATPTLNFDDMVMRQFVAPGGAEPVVGTPGARQEAAVPVGGGAGGVTGAAQRLLVG
ncbi:hypothetical protein ES703_31420 [subsurface metagenome]